MQISGDYNSYGSALFNNGVQDAEYKKIIQELRLLGEVPSGNKSADKAKLKELLAEKIEEKAHNNDSFKNQLVQQVDTDTKEMQELNKSQIGAMNLAELNKLYFGIS